MQNKSFIYKINNKLLNIIMIEEMY